MTDLSLNIVSIPVTDQSRALHFYTTTLGFTVLEDSPFERVPGEQARWVRLAPRRGGATITLVTWFPTMPPGSVKGNVLETEDLDAAMDTLDRRGVSFTHPVIEAPWARFTSFDDLDGNGWVLQQPSEAARGPGAGT